MRNLLLTLRFDGKNYHGWQVQKNALTVQQVLQDAIEKTTNNRDNVIGCSRTDAGVHANMYCCSVKTDSSIPCDHMPSALNTHLPGDIAVVKCDQADINFHARYDCLSKQYIYKIYNAPIMDPFLQGYAMHYKYKLPEELLWQQAQSFIGRHDYASFCAIGGSVDKTVKNVMSCGIKRDGDMIIFEVEANGFLYNMVRIMCGTLLEIAQGKIEKDSIGKILKLKDRDKAGFTVPACGLYLNKVSYGSEGSVKQQ
ncbi:MAG: tRNA pseudouridine(38-40) synthase TruA [Oscillospiraceae bacterium]|jgi:tRNA pseudouridine38-40 synthase|nr:tRNA pseudouridine(38-40) synthase TruA [Oscillospiraceae bacterium]